VFTLFPAGVKAAAAFAGDPRIVDKNIVSADECFWQYLPLCRVRGHQAYSPPGIKAHS